MDRYTYLNKQIEKNLSCLIDYYYNKQFETIKKILKIKDDVELDYVLNILESLNLDPNNI